MYLPDKFLASMKEILKEEYPEFLKSYNEKRRYGLRVNQAKISNEEFERICPFSIQRIPWIPNGYFYDETEQPAKHPYYFAGLYYLQEPSAMTPASRLPVNPGEAVLDLCAAPGGKATELGVKLQGKGVLVANDVSISRARALLKNIELFGVPNAFVASETPNRLRTCFEGFFDKVLVDAPCSGEGMFRKDPSIVKNWENLGNEHYTKLQKEIVVPAAEMLKPGGMMLYSTCTFSPEEDEKMVQYILEQNNDLELKEMQMYEGFSKGLPWVADGNLELEKCVRIWPHKMPAEGHFMALFAKTGDLERRGNESRSTNRNAYQRGDKRMMKGKKGDAEEFYGFMERVRIPFQEDRIEFWGDRAYYMPERLGPLTGMRFLRNGLLLGERKKNRFEPSQSLAMALKGEEYEDVISFSVKDDRVIRYLKGESVDITGIRTLRHTGWHLACVDGYPLGWGKLMNGVLKNKYQVGWRWL